jgi:hypothetical protein
LNDGRIQNPSNTFGIVPLSNFLPRGFGFVYHSIAILYHEVPNPNLTIRNFFIAVRHRRLQAARSSRPGKQSSAERPCPCRSSPTRWTGGGAVSSSGWTCCWTTWATRTSAKSTWVSHLHPLSVVVPPLAQRQRAQVAHSSYPSPHPPRMEQRCLHLACHGNTPPWPETLRCGCEHHDSGPLLRAPPAA